jgi:antitoxin component YwqK of YwqJK toxin-antitoxin module
MTQKRLGDDLHIAEVQDEAGRVRQRYARYLAADGRSWVRHGLFRAYSVSGGLISEGTYEHGLENGLWRDYHDNGQVAAQGSYRGGREDGEWCFWRDDGELEQKCVFVNGVEVDSGGSTGGRTEN